MKQVEIIEGQKQKIDRRNSKVIEQLKVAAYCRVSTDSDEQLLSYNSQVEHYTNLINSKPEWILVDIYADEGITGTSSSKRFDFQRMINDCVNGNIDMVITKSISRFARNTLDTLKYVRLLKEHNVSIVFEKENINTFTMNGELLLTILSSLAQQESESTSQNVKMGLKMKMKRGELIGFQGCLGYDYDPVSKTLSTNEEEAEIVRYIFKRYNEGIGCFIIAKELETLGYKTKKGSTNWGDTSVRGIIKNEKYKGDLLMGKTFTKDPISKKRVKNLGEEDKYYIKDHHPAIVSEETYLKAQEILNKRSKNFNQGKSSRFSRQYPFSSKIKCGFCDSTASRRKWHSGTAHNKDIWQCVTATKKGKKYCLHSKGLEEKIIEDAFVVAYNMLCQNNKDIIEEFLKNVEEALNNDTIYKKLKKVNSDITTLENKMNKLVDLQISNLISKEAYEEQYHKLTRDIEKSDQKKYEYEEAVTNEKALKERLRAFKKVLEGNSYLTEFDADVFENIVEKIILGGENEDGTINPFLITFIFKTGLSTPYDCSPQKTNGNIKKVYPNKATNACGVRSKVGERKILKYQKESMKAMSDDEFFTINYLNIMEFPMTGGFIK